MSGAGEAPAFTHFVRRCHDALNKMPESQAKPSKPHGRSPEPGDNDHGSDGGQGYLPAAASCLLFIETLGFRHFGLPAWLLFWNPTSGTL